MNNTYDEKRILKQLSNPATSRQAFAEVVAQYGEQLYWSIRRMVLVHRAHSCYSKNSCS